MDSVTPAVPLAETTAPELRPARRLLAAEESFAPLGCGVLVVPCPDRPSPEGDGDSFRRAFAGRDHGEELAACAEDGFRVGYGGILYVPPGEAFSCVLLYVRPLEGWEDRRRAWADGRHAARYRRKLRAELSYMAGWTARDPFGAGLSAAAAWALARPGLPSDSGVPERSAGRHYRTVLAHEIGHRRVRQALRADGRPVPVGSLIMEGLWGRGLRPPTLYAATAPGEWFAEAYSLWWAGRCDAGNAAVVAEVRECVRSGRTWEP